MAASVGEWTDVGAPPVTRATIVTCQLITRGRPGRTGGPGRTPRHSTFLTKLFLESQIEQNFWHRIALSGCCPYHMSNCNVTSSDSHLKMSRQICERSFLYYTQNTVSIDFAVEDIVYNNPCSREQCRAVKRCRRQHCEHINKLNRYDSTKQTQQTQQTQQDGAEEV